MGLFQPILDFDRTRRAIFSGPFFMECSTTDGQRGCFMARWHRLMGLQSEREDSSSMFATNHIMGTSNSKADHVLAALICTNGIKRTLELVATCDSECTENVLLVPPQ
jgi:hypothetical protein